MVVKDQNGNVVDEWTSSCDVGSDSHEISLDPGTYTLTEEITPEGYATAETITFTVDSNGNVDTSLDMKDAPIEACILKTSEDSEEGLPGGEFEIYKEDGTLYEKFTSDYVATCFPYMPVGTYTIKEVKAPEGYKISNEEVTITVEGLNLLFFSNEVNEESIVTGTIGAFAFIASFILPFLKGNVFPSKLLVPSGKIIIEYPSFKFLTPSFIILTPSLGFCLSNAIHLPLSNQ